MSHKDNQNHVSATLPIDYDGSINLNTDEARSFGCILAEEYSNADPYPHIVIDNFLPINFIEQILKVFPSEKLSDDKFYEDGYSGLHKRQVSPESCDYQVRNLFHFFNSAPILEFLESLTSIDGLVPDPYYSGGGFHEMFRGGKLGIHADFRINERLHLERRINMLIYLNRDWDSEYGGELEIWSKDMKTKRRSVSPIFNRCVIFNTDADSYHGHPEPLNTPEDVTRKSIALYYYTASRRIYEDTPANSTMYVARPSDSSLIKRQALILRAQNYLKDWLPPISFRVLSKIRRVVKHKNR